MPYKDPEKQKAAQADHYQQNKKDYRERFRQVRIKRERWYYELKSKLSCKQCGESHPGCLEFHHRDPATKKLNVSQMVNRGMSQRTIMEEIAKCDVLCSNCHQKLHWEERKRS